jgi:hypothetical protein
VVSKYPLKEVIQSLEAEGRIAKWALELMEQSITYAPHTAIKSQALVDFVVEWTKIQMLAALIEHKMWAIYSDGSLTKEGGGAGLVFISPQGVRMGYMIRLHFPISNNVTEYEAFLNRLKITLEVGVRRLEV